MNDERYDEPLHTTQLILYKNIDRFNLIPTSAIRKRRKMRFYGVTNKLL